MLAQYFTRLGNPVRYAVGDPGHNRAMQNLIATALRAYSVPAAVRQGLWAGFEGQHANFPLEGHEPGIMRALFRTGDPAHLGMLTDLLADRGVPHEFRPTTPLTYTTRSEQGGPGGGLLGTLLHIHGMTQDPLNYHAFHPQTFNNPAVMRHLQDLLHRPSLPAEAVYHGYHVTPGNSVMDRLHEWLGRLTGQQSPHLVQAQHAVSQLGNTGHPAAMRRVYNIAEHHMDTLPLNTGSFYPSEDMSMMLHQHVIPELRRAVGAE